MLIVAKINNKAKIGPVTFSPYFRYNITEGLLINKLMTENDSALVLAAQAGEAQAFGQLYDKYFQLIYRFIYYKVGHRETCEDLTSLTFTKALEKINSFSAKTKNFSGWLFAIARNSVIDHYRTVKPMDDLSAYPELQQKNYPEQDLDNRELLNKVKKYLDNLSEEQREIVVMRVWLNMSYLEIAQALNKSEVNCRMIFSRTIKKMQISLTALALLISLINI